MRTVSAVVVTALVALGLFAQPVAAVTTSITLKPSVGPPTTKVSVNGTGFGASETITVDFSATQVATATTSSTGSFSIKFTVPTAALPGTYPVKAIGNTSGLSATHNFLVRTDWPKFHFDSANSGYNPYENVIGPSNVSGLKTAWTEGHAGDAAVAKGVAYVGYVDGSNVYAYSAAGTTNCSGTPKACTPLRTYNTGDTSINTAPTVANGVVYVSGPFNYSPGLDAFSAAGTTNCSGTPKTCTPLWTGAIPGNPGFGASATSPTVVNGVVYVGADDYRGHTDLYAFSAAGTTNCSGTPKTCKPLWTGATASYISSAPAVANGVVYVGAGDDKLYAFSAAGTTNCSGTPKTCSPLWTGSTGSTGTGIEASPAVANGAVYVTSNSDGDLYAFSAAGTTDCSGTPKTCTPLWSGSLGAIASQSSPAVANGVVYAGGYGADLYAFSAAGTTNCSGTPTTCSPLWTGTGSYGDSSNSSPAVANGVVYLGSQSSSTGSLLNAFSAAGTTNCSGTPKTCTPLWTGPAGQYFSSSPAIANGVVYATSTQKLYAFSP